MRTCKLRGVRWAAAIVAGLVWSLLGNPGVVGAIELGEQAPGFSLPATTGVNIALSDFKGKKWVLLEFYGLDYAPT